MKFLIQNNLLSEVQLSLTRESIKDFPHQFIEMIPFTEDIQSDVPIDGLDYIPYGSTSLTMISYIKGFKGLHFDLETFNHNAFLKNRDDMLNNGMVDSLVNIVNYLETQKADKIWFIRPSDDLKQFSGCILKNLDIIDWLRDRVLCASSGSYRLEPTTQILISEPRNIQCEWRYFIIDHKIVSGSMYKYRDRLRKLKELDNDVLKEAQSFADKWLPDSCCVMDLALVDDEIKVIEFNCINSSGFYDHDIKKIFTELWSYHK